MHDAHKTRVSAFILASGLRGDDCGDMIYSLTRLNRIKPSMIAARDEENP
ncbi:MAG: hypothetical protein ACOYKQ_04985 [Polymorphobacter sp.]